MKNSTPTNHVRTGRSYADLIAEHPKKILIAFIFLLLVIVVILVFVKRPIKAGPFEAGSIPPMPNTVIAEQQNKKTDSVITENKIEKRKPITKSITVTKGDTTIKVQGQPANIVVGTNNGINGNNNKVEINYEEKQRYLTVTKIKMLSDLVRKEADSLKLRPGFRVAVAHAMGNREASILAKDIYTSLTPIFKNVTCCDEMVMSPNNGVRISHYIERSINNFQKMDTTIIVFAGIKE